ncbi:hypothetical protein GCM10027212_27770 [Actinotalea caeni]
MGAVVRVRRAADLVAQAVLAYLVELPTKGLEPAPTAAVAAARREAAELLAGS